MVKVKSNGFKMMQPELFEPARPRAPRMHALFGSKYFKNHKFIDKKWSYPQFIDQYCYMVKLLEKRTILNKFEVQDKKKKLKEIYSQLKVELQKGRSLLSSRLVEVQKIHNILLNDPTSERLYVRMSTHAMVELTKQRTFSLRKERDKYCHTLKVLMQKYEAKLLEKSRVEDLINWQDAFILPEETEIKKYLSMINGYKIRNNGLGAIQRAYRKTIEILRRDALYYEPVLNSLEGDIIEQQKFIQHVIILGLPAQTKQLVLRNRLKNAELETIKITEDTKTMLTNLKHVVHKEEIVTIDKVRQNIRDTGVHGKYLRTTESMRALALESAILARQINELENATVALSTKNIVYRFEATAKILEPFRKFLGREEELLEKIKVQKTGLQAVETERRFAFTDEDEEICKRIEKYKKKINYEQRKQKEIQKFIDKTSWLYNNLKLIVWHLNDCLRHVGNKLEESHITYPNVTLKLRLLDFPENGKMGRPPPRVIENIDALLNELLLKAEIIGRQHNALRILPDALFQVQGMYQTLLHNKQNEHEQMPEVPQKHLLSDIEVERENKKILTREQMKKLSLKLVDLKKKKDWE